jgi:hypothetical protein
MGLWVYGFKGLRVYGFMGLWVYGFTGLRVVKFHHAKGISTIAPFGRIRASR